MRRTQHLSLTGIALGVALTVAGSATGQADQLILEPPGGQLAVTPPAHAKTIQRVGVNFALLEAIGPGGSFEITLGGNNVVAVVTEVIPQLDGYSIMGHFEQFANSSFGIAVVDDAAAAWFSIPERDRSVRLRYGGPDRLHYLHELDGEKLGPCAGTFDNRNGAQPGGGNNDPGADPDIQALDILDDAIRLATQARDGQGGELDGGCFPPPQDYFDVAVFYTDDARADAGGTNAIRAECALAVVRQSETYARSILNNIRPRLVHRSEVSYAETGDIYEDLDNFLDGSAGLGGTHTIRNNVEADFAVLLTADGGGFCGLAPCFVGASEAYTIVKWDCAVDNMSFAHEIGHIIGCDHDPDEGEGTGCFSSAGLGHYFWVPDESMWRHTVMSYSNNGSSRIPYYSHPQVEYMGVPTGTSSRDNVSVIANRTNTCEGFRLTRMDVWVDFNWGGSENGSFNLPFDTVAEGANRILDEAGMSEVPVLRIKPGSRNESLTINKPMFIEACGGTVTIGQ